MSTKKYNRKLNFEVLVIERCLLNTNIIALISMFFSFNTYIRRTVFINQQYKINYDS